MIDNQAQSEIQTEVNIGEQFRQAREALNFSLEYVSREINLRTSILECIENNKVGSLPLSPTFLKGYVRNYARFLNLPEHIWSPMIVALDRSGKSTVDLSIKPVSKRTNPFLSNHRWIGYITVLVVLIVLAMSALWWWEQHQQVNEERDRLVDSYLNNASTDNNGTVTNKLDALSTTDSTSSNLTHSSTSNNSNFPEVPINIDGNQMITESISDSSNNSVDKTLDVADSKNITTDINQNTENTNTTSPNEQLIDIQNNTNPVTNDGKKADSAIIPELKIEITGSSCWLSVKNNRGKILAQKEYTQGEVLTFDEGTPYSLIIGAPSNVRITYKGEEYPLTVDGRVAKFTLQ